MEITLPLSTDVLERLCTLGLKCACRSLCSASALARPLTSGTPTLAGPVETTTLTCEPRCTTLPAAGFSEITAPSATLRLGACEGTGTRSAVLSSVVASDAERPTTLGTVTWRLFVGSSSASATPVAASASSTPPAIHQRRLRRRADASPGVWLRILGGGREQQRSGGSRRHRAVAAEGAEGACLPASAGATGGCSPAPGKLGARAEAPR